MRIKAIIFDVGGVLNKGLSQLIELIQCFETYGIILQEDFWLDEACQQCLVDFQTGKYGVDEASARPFFEDIRTHASLDESITFEQFKQAWNAAIIGLNYELLDNLSIFREQGLRLFILSDANPLHRAYAEELYQEKYPGKTLRSLFDKCYFSHETGHYKCFSGDEANQAWLQVLNENNLESHECLFVDDKLELVNKARNLGLSGLHYQNTRSTQILLHALDVSEFNDMKPNQLFLSSDAKKTP
ncbi:MAG: hypothetical protein P1U39_08205 [Legionellaceae bacterium]|nr:hypothetical protein [Legionellaceae bacterium]